MLKRAHSIVVVVVGLLVLLLLNLPPGVASRLKLAVGGVFLPLLGLRSAAHSVVETASYEMLPRSTLVSELRRLEQENAALRVESALGAEAIAENQRLRGQLGSVPRGTWRPRLARVVGRDATTWWRTCLIDYGARDGAAVNQPVVTAQGLVGGLRRWGIATAMWRWSGMRRVAWRCWCRRRATMGLWPGDNRRRTWGWWR